jgi:hypothetical protein
VRDEVTRGMEMWPALKAILAAVSAYAPPPVALNPRVGTKPGQRRPCLAIQPAWRPIPPLTASCSAAQNCADDLGRPDSRNGPYRCGLMIGAASFNTASGNALVN